MSRQLHILLSIGQFPPVGNTDLLFDEVNPCYPLCYRMLHLNTGIHFHKIKTAGFFKQKLNGSRIDIPCSLCRIYRRFPHFLTHCITHNGTRRFFNQLLVISLDGAVTLAQMDHMTITIRQNLELDMFRMLHKVLQIHSIIAKSCHRLLLGCHKSIFQFILMISHTHAFAAAAKGRLDNDRIPHFFCNGQCFFCMIQRFLASRDHRYPCRDHRISGIGFIAEFADDICGWSDENNMTLLT